MLQASPGWRIAVIDHHGVLLVRGNRGIEEPSPETARKEFRDSSDQAVYLARSALVMKSLERSAAAGQLMAAAQSLDGKNPAVLLCAGSLAAQEGRWSAAREAAEQALQAMPSSAQAAYLLALAQFESGALSKASTQIQKLADRHPEDFQILQLQARIAKANNDPSTEVDALEKLLALSKKRRLLPGNLHILLGQAWAKRGFPDQALQNYQAALDANPPPELKTQIEEAMAVIRKNTR
jgi:tetratricopeptide (TPR) repeat protein